MGATIARMYPPFFDPERDMPDLSGKVILVTGGNVGIGYETVKYLLMKNAKVYLAARSPDKAVAAIKRLEEETKKSAIFLELDLADLKSVRKAAEEFLEKEGKLDVLFNNAGVMNAPSKMLTVQDYDLQFGTNVLGHFFFTELLLPALKKSYEETQIPARVINVSSVGHRYAPGKGINFASLKKSAERDKYVKWSSWRLYGQSKIGNIYTSNYWAKTHSDVLVSCSLNPGGIKTDLYRHSGKWFEVLIDWTAFPTYLGAYTQLCTVGSKFNQAD
ncbi:NAD(P)-binding protein [Roridomyces roridus]|uniref:NAD(P)-binding protein n=1 Tax=Roridomyces roridus TaxID=1738132 RepID=A0AAD7C971_9AGAR|nr:NAD(P)-binding protein [Roridomyces roridus]